ncbi:lasso peptide biosynthesis PqqD family chaperone [Amycolatopsis sp. H20-H5]|uniref:lasso peptide biosynthesis PqqD family chaperone n=1 Tax=Amycolatopsis sp. H20-H5 TaxID=3046309 RepID=UPI002DBC5DBF|nr:lasso peptide biosynthesis PqqD family chaperone [Amycolatopsis sp. H20-H5]MEC3975572.1 lasso peptide biosynthesis PqqD family chaperone [Amycolatopsis sp. H20-H5]
MRLREDVSAVETDGGGVVLDGRAGTYWQLNNSGWLALNAVLQSGQDVAAATLVARYSVAYDKAIADVRSLIDRLFEAELVLR